MNAEFAHLFALSPAERIQLVEDLWDSLANTPQAIPMPDWQKEELDQREAEYAKDPTLAVSWDEAKARIRNRHGR
jgi:putative addiction module component (TIGR02574 family)